ncbi:MAG: NUDIX domain-containing protein [Candidatus Woesearchaeota archaeon]|nr:MAG: NUDIX domain-containing protein [Candidatus Woesearchaeota archaeon]
MDKIMGFGVGVLLLKDNRVLLGKRNDDPKKADSLFQGEGKWTLPGGKVDFGEELEEAAKREVLEETGIKANNLKLISVTNDVKGHAHFATIGFLCEDFEGEARVMEQDILRWEWFALDDLPKPMFFPVEKLIKNFKEGVIYKH